MSRLIHSERRRVAIIGGTGFVGQRLARRWVRNGADVITFSRTAPAVPLEGTVPVISDLDRPAQLGKSLRGVDTAYYLVHGMADASDYADRDRRRAKAFLRAVRAARVPTVIYLGGFYPPQGDLSEHLASRRDVGRLLMEGCDALVLRAGVIVGSGSASWIMMRSLVQRFPILLAPGWPDRLCQPTGGGDVIRALCDAATQNVQMGREVDTGGPDILTYRQMMEITAELLGRGPWGPTISLPILSARISSVAVSAVTGVSRPLSQALIESLSYDMVSDGADLYRELGIRPRSFAATVRAAVKEDARP